MSLSFKQRKVGQISEYFFATTIKLQAISRITPQTYPIMHIHNQSHRAISSTQQTLWYVLHTVFQRHCESPVLLTCKPSLILNLTWLVGKRKRKGKTRELIEGERQERNRVKKEKGEMERELVSRRSVSSCYTKCSVPFIHLYIIFHTPRTTKPQPSINKRESGLRKTIPKSHKSHTPTQQLKCHILHLKAQSPEPINLHTTGRQYKVRRP